MQTGQLMWTVNYIQYLMMMMIAMMMMMMMITHAVVQANSSRTVRTIIEDEQLTESPVLGISQHS